MRHKQKKVILVGNKGHQRLLLKNLAMSVIIYEKIKTKAAKARAVKPLIDKLITIGKTKEKREAIRMIEEMLQHKNASRKILEVLAERYKDRTSGFTRITKLGYRSGDNAEVVQLELVN